MRLPSKSTPPCCPVWICPQKTRRGRVEVVVAGNDDELDVGIRSCPFLELHVDPLLLVVDVPRPASLHLPSSFAFSSPSSCRMPYSSDTSRIDRFRISSRAP